MLSTICTYNDSSLYLLYEGSKVKLTFKGKLEDIAHGIFLTYGKRVIEKCVTFDFFNILTHIVGPLYLKLSNNLNQLLLWDKNTRYMVGTEIEDPIFLDCLNEKYQDILLKYSRIKTFW